MPFKKMDINKVIENKMATDKEFEKTFNAADKEMEFIMELVKYREKNGLSQKDIAEKSGLTQQMVSRIETFTNYPSLRNLFKYIDALGLEVKLGTKDKNDEMAMTAVSIQ